VLGFGDVEVARELLDGGVADRGRDDAELVLGELGVRDGEVWA
jgi:hypothetical protein